MADEANAVAHRVECVIVLIEEFNTLIIFGEIIDIILTSKPNLPNTPCNQLPSLYH